MSLGKRRAAVAAAEQAAQRARERGGRALQPIAGTVGRHWPWAWLGLGLVIGARLDRPGPRPAAGQSTAPVERSGPGTLVQLSLLLSFAEQLLPLLLRFEQRPRVNADPPGAPSPARHD
ncbi:hypothetical protein [Aquimonas sp.]|jgi:hypothetical protein|uniref:hypothetical protein n=1 Tax=Aquimonas sp. TaxID=1872588 RepID=UPI0037BF4874